MSFDYAGLAERAKRLLEKFGVTGQFLALDGMTTRDKIVLRVETVMKEMPNVPVMTGDVKFLAEGNSAPVQGERLTIGSESWVVVFADPIAPAGFPVVWYVYGRIG